MIVLGSFATQVSETGQRLRVYDGGVVTEKYLVDFILEHGWLDYKSTLADIAYLCKIKTGHGSINQIRNHVYMLTSSSAPFEIIKDPNTKKKIIKKR